MIGLFGYEIPEGKPKSASKRSRFNPLYPPDEPDLPLDTVAVPLQDMPDFEGNWRAGQEIVNFFDDLPGGNELYKETMKAFNRDMNDLYRRHGLLPKPRKRHTDRLQRGSVIRVNNLAVDVPSLSVVNEGPAGMTTP